MWGVSGSVGNHEMSMTFVIWGDDFAGVLYGTQTDLTGKPIPFYACDKCHSLRKSPITA